MSSVRIERIDWSKNCSQISGLLDRAFAVKNYTRNFPHIFSDRSSAQIFAGFDEHGQMMGLCAVDTEIWTSPVFLRGACIGSVGVDPAFQRKGIGRQLMSAVVKELVAARNHDFVYLFSDQGEFYGALGFVPAGEEILDRPRRTPSNRSSAQCSFRPPIPTTGLTTDERSRLWAALEAGRRSTESISAFVKAQQVLNIPDTLVCWTQDRASGEIRAGAFVGKGIDFQGVVHSFFAHNPTALRDYWSQFLHYVGVHAEQMLVAAGGWRDCLSKELVESRRQSLCLVYEWIPRQPSVQSLFETQQLYPRALFSS